MTPQEAQEIIAEADKRSWFVNPAVRLIALRDPEAALEAAGIPLLREITPKPDPVYGHTFQCPEEVEQHFATQYGGASQGLPDGIIEHDDASAGAWK